VSLNQWDVYKALKVDRAGGPIHPRWRRLLLPPGPAGGRFHESPF
jgi:hypothetical protein